MAGVELISAQRWVALASGRGGAPLPEEWPFILAVLILLAGLGARLLRLVGLSRLEAVILSHAAPLLVLVNIPLGALGPGVAILANATGCLVPLGIAVGVVLTRRVRLVEASSLLLVAILVAYLGSRVVPGQGVLLEFQVCAMAIGSVGGGVLRRAPREAGAWCFAAGALGTIIGADVLRIHQLLAFPGAASITLGGAALLDGILLTAVMAALVGAAVAWGAQMMGVRVKPDPSAGARSPQAAGRHKHFGR